MWPTAAPRPVESISGTNQYLGAITGSGSTTVAAGGSVRVASIQQSSLVIGAGGVFTLAPSNSQGQPLSDAATVLRAAASSSPASVAAAPAQSTLLNSLAADSSAPASLSGSTAGALLGGEGAANSVSLAPMTLAGGGTAAVPEPSTMILAAIACGFVVTAAIRRRRALE